MGTNRATNRRTDKAGCSHVHVTKNYILSAHGKIGLCTIFSWWYNTKPGPIAYHIENTQERFDYPPLVSLPYILQQKIVWAKIYFFNDLISMNFYWDFLLLWSGQVVHLANKREGSEHIRSKAVKSCQFVIKILSICQFVIQIFN